MNNEVRIKRTAKLCLECLRGIAYYRGGISSKEKWGKQDFWIHHNSNSIDMAVIDWCKVFGDPKAEHYWEKSVERSEAIYPKLLAAALISEDEYRKYIKEMRLYRDKYLAHLDKENRMHIPRLDIALATTIFLYNFWAQGNPQFQNVVPGDAEKFYEGRLRYAEKKYATAT